MRASWPSCSFMRVSTSKRSGTRGRDSASVELLRDQREEDAQDGGSENADDDRLLALICRKSGRRQPDDDGVVAGENEIDGNDLKERGKARGSEDFHGAWAFLSDAAT